MIRLRYRFLEGLCLGQFMDSWQRVRSKVFYLQRRKEGIRVEYSYWSEHILDQVVRA